MRLETLRKLPKDTILQILEILRRDQRTIDGLWFLAVEEMYGLTRAVEIDAHVWGKIGYINAKRLKTAFNLRPLDISSLIKAINLDPLWLFFDYKIEQVSREKAVMRFRDCPAQKGRLRMGKGTFPCRSVDEGYFIGFCKEIDERIRVHCAYCPPEQASDDFLCEWHFLLC
jgi:hypothetical protein